MKQRAQCLNGKQRQKSGTTHQAALCSVVSITITAAVAVVVLVIVVVRAAASALATIIADEPACPCLAIRSADPKIAQEFTRAWVQNDLTAAVGMVGPDADAAQEDAFDVACSNPWARNWPTTESAKPCAKAHRQDQGATSCMR